MMFWDLARHPPYAATLAMMVVALAANALAWNPIWLWYTTVGLGVMVGLMTWQAHAQRAVPDRLVWLIGATSSLHYVGGSLSGSHRIAGPNGLYYMFPWWDNLVHFLGSAALAGLVLATWPPRLAGERALRGFTACMTAVAGGVFVELFEFLNFVSLGTVDQGFYVNSMLDLYYNLLGALAALLIAGGQAARLPGTKEGSPSS